MTESGFYGWNVKKSHGIPVNSNLFTRIVKYRVLKKNYGLFKPLPVMYGIKKISVHSNNNNELQSLCIELFQVKFGSKFVMDTRCRTDEMRSYSNFNGLEMS